MTLTQTNPANQTNLRKLDKFLGLILIASALAVSLYLIIKANRDLLYPYALFMDERVTYDGVKKILHPDSLISLLDLIIDGEDHRYGRILWNLSAFFSAIPEKFWGSHAQVFSTRMTQAIFQLVSYLILLFYFANFWIIRGIGLWALVTLPETVYFSTMPKPEPILLFFLSIFLILSFKYSFKFGYHWIFLGISLSLKISVVPIIPLFLFLALINLIKDPSWVTFPLNIRFLDRYRAELLLKATLIVVGLYQIFGSLLIGLKGNQSRVYQLFFEWSDILNSTFNLSLSSETVIFICMIIPLIFGIIILTLSFLISYTQKSNLVRISTLLKTLLIFIGGMAISTPALLLKVPKGIMFWLGHSAYSAIHNSNDQDLETGLQTFFSWINFIVEKWTSVNSEILIMFFWLSSLIICFSIILSIKLLNSTESKSLTFFENSKEIILLLVAFLFASPIVFKVQQLWSHYLHFGSVFFTVSVLISSNKILLYKHAKPFYKRIVLFFIAVLVLIYSIGVWPQLLNDMMTKFSLLSQRTNTSSFVEESRKYTFLTNFFDEISNQYPNPVVIAFDRSLFVPESTDKWEIEEFYTTMRWDISHDFVIMNRLQKDQKKYVDGSLEEHLILSENKACDIKPCYRELGSPHPDLLILERIDSFH
jgi:hypothetical protein